MIKNEELAKKLYRKGLTVVEISNLTNISTAQITKLFRKCFINGELEPRRKTVALSNRPPKGCKKVRLTQKQLLADDIICDLSLRNARRRKGWTQKEFAELIGTSQVLVSHWENGAEPSPRYIRKIKELFDN